jgi:O-antigen ligase
MPDQLGHGQTLLHYLGAAASLVAGLLTLSRGLVIALFVIALIDIVSDKGFVRRKIWIGMLLVILIAGGIAKFLYPDIYRDRTTDPENFYQRIAQDKETLQVIKEHPIFGIGLNFYNEVTSQDPQYLVRWRGVESMNVPHNALMSVLAEEGLIGLFFYIASQLFLIRAMWRLRHVYPAGYRAFLYFVSANFLIGLDFAVNSYADVNLLYMFCLGIVYGIQISKLRGRQSFYRSHLYAA